jgi:radical SAM protein with 4Fe4S-binding SPASM domain
MAPREQVDPLPPKPEQQRAALELDRGLRRIEVWPGVGIPSTRNIDVPKAPRRGFFSSTARTPDATAPSNTMQAVLLRAGTLLVARGAPGESLRFGMRWDGTPRDTGEALSVARETFTVAAMAGKQLHVAFSCAFTGTGALEGHRMVYRVICTTQAALDAAISALGDAASGPRAAAKAFAALPDGATGEAQLEPQTPRFAEAVEALHSAGLNVIEVDMEAPFLAQKGVRAADVAQELQRCAEYYAAALAKGDYFRLEPIAGLFHRIYLGMPARRTDPTGLWALVADGAGAVYPSSAFLGREEHRVGNIMTDGLDLQRLARYEDIGAVTTPVCYGCWARNLCGGGPAVVHDALTGSFRTPSTDWCNAQRAWMQAAIAAFNTLSGEGVNFARLYGQLGKRAKVSLFTMVRAAFQMNIGLRPLGEADAELLTKWENFCDAAYFTFTETGLLMATKYDREMDALHPKGHEFEFLLLRKNGAPMGLLRLRPLPMPGAAMAWIYLRNTGDYADESVRKSFRFVLGEAGKQQGIGRLLAPCGPFDGGLEDFLKATGFTHSGDQREALYLRGAYHPVSWFSAAPVA